MRAVEPVKGRKAASALADLLRFAGHNRQSATRSALARALFYVLPVLLAAVLLPASADGHTLAGNKRAARSDAQALLGQVQLPSGAVQSASEPTGGGAALASPAISIATSALVDTHEWWTVPASMSSVIAYVKAHVPQGWKMESTGSEVSSGTTTNEFVEFSFPAVRGVLSERQLVVDVAPLPGGQAGVRADAEIEWTVPRPATERVPRGARVLTVTRGSGPGWSPFTMTFAEPPKIRAVARLLDRLPITQPVAIACPLIPVTPYLTLTFRARPDGPPLARASMLASGPDGECGGINFSVRGHREPPLYAMPSFLRKLTKVLGIPPR